jgi:hypothetical protein
MSRGRLLRRNISAAAGSADGQKIPAMTALDRVQTSQHASGFAPPALFDQLCLIFKREVRTKDPVSVFGDRLSLTA